jgi:hypothetical protein
MTTSTTTSKNNIITNYTINFVWIQTNNRRKKKNITDTLNKYIIKWTWKKENLSTNLDKIL